ncbi:hypothetical protein TNCV_4316311 [Trichonephila clavipes]|nr:hypothetical protein TNCV_4316311 [Trichonephila clavipes]
MEGLQWHRDSNPCQSGHESVTTKCLHHYASQHVQRNLDPYTNESLWKTNVVIFFLFKKTLVTEENARPPPAEAVSTDILF